MTHIASVILGHLETVAQERRVRVSEVGLLDNVQAVKAYQQRRFSHTYADLLSTPRYSKAARFFLDELYGPSDFTQRDEQFARVVPALVRLFPTDVVETVATLAQLHALSEQLDTAMGRQLTRPEVDAECYISAWRATGHRAEREQQITLTVSVGRALDALTQKPFLRQSLRMMRIPARAAGLSALQEFLEAGFDTFRAMHGAEEFLQLVKQREETLYKSLFGADPSGHLISLGQLP